MANGLSRVYRQIPALECKGLCQASCTGPIPASETERQLVAAKGRALPVLKSPCDNLVEGRCAVYEDRPLICRLWGVVENMPCPHGCVPEGGHLTRAQGGDLVAQAVRLAGEAI